MSTANHSVSKYRNKAQKLEEKQSSKEVRAHQTDNGRVGWDHQIHTSRLPRMIRNHMYTRLSQAPCQLCLTTSLLATDGISHDGPRFFTLVQPWRTSISSVYDFTVFGHCNTFHRFRGQTMSLSERNNGERNHSTSSDLVSGQEKKRI